MLKEVKLEDIPPSRVSGSERRRVAEAFIDSGMEAAELTTWHGEEIESDIRVAKSALTNLMAYAKTNNLPLKAVLRRGKVYLIRTDDHGYDETTLD